VKVAGEPTRSIRVASDGFAIEVIDQTRLPFAFAWRRLETPADAAEAIRSMRVRGAPLIGATAAYGLCLQARRNASDAALAAAHGALLATRPTAVNLRWALDRVLGEIRERPVSERAERAYALAAAICDEDVARNRAIGEHGLHLLEAAAERRRGAAVPVLTHCNAGWLATVDFGTALAPLYLAHERGIPVHVFVDETRPRNQGASLTCWELAQNGIPHTLIADNAGGHLMQRGAIDLCLVGSDRTTRDGDVCNKIGTYLKALAARDNGVPFYVALPSPTIDFAWSAPAHEIPIEERDSDELLCATGRSDDGAILRVRLAPDASPASNPAFDVTPARLVSALITERGVCAASRAGIAALFPEAGA
jgi:methylthioribose-1-phosphate isomerase